MFVTYFAVVLVAIASVSTFMIQKDFAEFSPKDADILGNGTDPRNKIKPLQRTSPGWTNDCDVDQREDPVADYANGIALLDSRQKIRTVKCKTDNQNCFGLFTKNAVCKQVYAELKVYDKFKKLQTIYIPCCCSCEYQPSNELRLGQAKTNRISKSLFYWPRKFQSPIN